MKRWMALLLAGLLAVPQGVVYAEELTDAQVGDHIIFGMYEQDNDLSNGAEPVEWRVLDAEEGKILVVSEYALDANPYNERYEETTWESCTLRAWLNADFFNMAFTNSEQEQICTVPVVAEDNPSYGTEAGSDTQDKIFLLSVSEAERYFSSGNDFFCSPTLYALAMGAWAVDASGENYGKDANLISQAWDGNCYWWLRSPGESPKYAAVVNFGGTISEAFVDGKHGNEAGYEGSAVRPAMWISTQYNR